MKNILEINTARDSGNAVEDPNILAKDLENITEAYRKLSEKLERAIQILK